MSAGKFLYRNTSGNFVEGEISLQDHEQAARKNVRTSQIINAKYPDADPQFGTAWQQGLRSAGIYPKGVKDLGIPATTVQDAMSGECMQVGGLLQMAGNTIVAPSVPIGSSTPASRLFLPEVILGFMESALQENFDLEVGLFDSLIADDFSIAGPVYTQPTITSTAPAAYDSRPIAQNALPRNLTSITASQSSKSIATESYGLQISDQATQLATLSLVQIIMNQQTRGARYRMLWDQLAKLVTGNTDAGESALSSVGFKATYDSAAAATTITHKGWLKCLYEPDRTVKYDALICTLDTYLDIQNRTGRPLLYSPVTTGVNTGNAGNYGLDVTLTAPANFAQLGIPKVMIVPDGTGLAANQYLLLDTTMAIRRVTNSLASYSAVESMILQRSTFFRVDWGFIIHRLIDDAFKLVDYTNG